MEVTFNFINFFFKGNKFLIAKSFILCAKVENEKH